MRKAGHGSIPAELYTRSFTGIRSNLRQGFPGVYDQFLLAVEAAQEAVAVDAGTQRQCFVQSAFGSPAAFRCADMKLMEWGKKDKVKEVDAKAGRRITVKDERITDTGRF
jgi:hypothetical protein